MVFQIIDRDANINVQANAVKVFTALGNGLRSRFIPYISQFLPILFDKFKEKKPALRDPLIECCDSLGDLVGCLILSVKFNFYISFR